MYHNVSHSQTQKLVTRRFVKLGGGFNPFATWIRQQSGGDLSPKQKG